MKLGVRLEPGKSYVYGGNIFAKSMILKENRTLFPLLICEKQEHIALYIKMLDFFDVECSEMKSVGDLIDLVQKRRICITSQEHIHHISEYHLEKKESFSFHTDQKISPEKCIETLISLGYQYSEFSKIGSFKKVGDTLFISGGGKTQYQISFWGDVIENIFMLDSYLKEKLILKHTASLEKEYTGTQDVLEFEQKQELSECRIGSTRNLSDIQGSDDICTFLEKSGVPIICDGLDFSPLYETLHRYTNTLFFDLIESHKKEQKNLGVGELNISTLEDFTQSISSKKTIFFTKTPHIIENFINFNEIQNSEVIEANISVLKSFTHPQVQCICDDILLKIFTKRRIKKSTSRDYDLLLKISPGDYVVHINHGIGVYKGIVKKEFPVVRESSIEKGPGIVKMMLQKEYLEIEYQENDRLFVPITEVERITKYVGLDNPTLTSLNSDEWTKRLAKVDKDVQRVAEELLEIYAQRKASQGLRFDIDRKQVENFQKDFPYIYTQDQQKCIEEIFEDMQSDKNMDRVLIGDVGFGKTEVAFNAIFQAYCNKKQSIFISPLVVLAYEHYNKALERFRNSHIRIGILTRLESDKKARATLAALANGEVDLLIGTHRVLSEKIQYKNLGLIVIDEEHKFGVEDKEKIKKLKANLDCLAMSATPIPRSLNMALSGIRDISTLREPPHGRKDIKTFVVKYDESLIEQVCTKEFDRGGQVFFIHNRVENIEHIKNMLERIFPEKKIVITHGKLTGDQLEDRIIDFKNKKYDILLSTTVIENGIDFSNVNTIIINECQSFGLSQIHQLRGRVGRSDKEGYCYLVYKKEVLPEESIKRLKTIVKYSYLGSGFEIAIKDLEIRGGGDILGIRQSGQKADIGVNLYLQLLEEKIASLKQNGGVSSHHTDVSIDLQVEALIPDEYFSGETDKLNFYREIESINSLEDLESVIKGFTEINPELPQSIHNLFAVIELKVLAKQYAMIGIKRSGVNYQIDFTTDITPEKLKSFLSLDKEVRFCIVHIDKIRTSKKDFSSDQDFLYYLLHMLRGEVRNKKIRLKNSSM